MNVTELCRRNMYRRLGVETKERRDPDRMSAEITGMVNKLNEIVELARPRLIMGGIRYGSEWQHDTLMSDMQRRFDIYKTTGNFEMLVDFLNLIAVEGKLQTHPDFHFKPVERKD